MEKQCLRADGTETCFFALPILAPGGLATTSGPADNSQLGARGSGWTKGILRSMYLGRSQQNGSVRRNTLDGVI